LILFFGGGLTEILVGVKMWRDPGWWARRQAASDGNEGININLELSQEGLAQAAVGKVGAAVIYPHRRVLATCLIALGLAFWAALGFAVHRLLH
jgi:hypothetical protein